MRWRPEGSPLAKVVEETGVASVWELCSASLTLYACWWLVYTLWLLIIGHALPERGWGRSSFADNRGTIARKFGVGDDRPRTQALVYCLLHAAVCGVLMTTVPLLLYRSCERAPPCAALCSRLILTARAAADALHTCFLVLLLCSAVWQGASNYHYTFGAKVEKALRVALQAEVTKTR